MIRTSEAVELLCLTDADTALVRKMIARATDTLGRHLGGLYLGEPTHRSQLFCGGHDVVALDQTPTDGVVTVWTRRDVFDAWTILDTTLWRLEGWHVFARTYFPAGRLTVKVEYPVGWEPGTGPEELQQLVREMLAVAYGSGEGIAAGMKSETLGDYSYTREDIDSLPSYRNAMAWRRMRV